MKPLLHSVSAPRVSSPFLAILARSYHHRRRRRRRRAELVDRFINGVRSGTNPRTR
jgi:hypothetical protein